MLWSTVSKAALRSNSTKIAEAPESRVRRISLWTFKSADSVLCNALKPDWKTSSTELFLKNVCNWTTTTFSKTLDRKGSFEIGLKLDSSVESKLDLFIKGCTIACLKWAGMEPVAKQRLIRIRILWPTTLKTCFKKTSRDNILGTNGRPQVFNNLCQRRDGNRLKLVKDSRACHQRN